MKLKDITTLVNNKERILGYLVTIQAKIKNTVEKVSNREIDDENGHILPMLLKVKVSMFHSPRNRKYC